MAKSLLSIGRLQDGITWHLANLLHLDLLQQSEVIVGSLFDLLDSVGIKLLSIKRYLLKALGLDLLEPSSDLLDLLLSNLRWVEVSILPAVTGWVVDDASEELRELDHVLSEQLYGLLAVLPTVCGLARVAQDLQLLRFELQVQTQVQFEATRVDIEGRC